MPQRSEHPHYELLERCGGGGMGVVYKARDKRLNRTVALKFLLPEQLERRDSLARFQREAEAIAALSHPNIAVIYEIGEWDEEPFLAMEYLAGGTLKSRLRPGGLAVEETLHIASRLGAGIQFAHEQGILHRDIKPANAMFNSRGELKLVDFGLAKYAGAAQITTPGAAVGTIGFIAPEILEGGEATVKSDVYAFGGLVYELAAGRPMFPSGRQDAVLYQALKGSPVPLNSIRNDLPDSFSKAVAKATARRPEDRFASIAEFLDHLGAPSEPRVSAPPLQPTQTISLETATKRKPVSIRTIAVAAVAVLIMGAAAAVSLPGVRAWMVATFNHGGATEQTVVVLPFENLGGDPANAVLCDGLQETVSSILSEAGAAGGRVAVVPTAELRRNNVRTISDARRQFNADLALTGSVLRSTALQITLNLSNAASMRQKDSRILSVLPSDTADLPQKLARELRELFGEAPLSRANAAAPGRTTRNPKAYDLYLRGDGALESHNYDAAIDFLKRSLDLDPEFPLARAKLAQTYLSKNSGTKDPTWLAMADAEASRAARSGNSPEVLFVEAMIRRSTGDTDRAIQLFRQVLAIAPNHVEAYRGLAASLDAAGRPKEAEETYQQAIRLRPGYWPTYNTLATFYMGKHEYAKAEQAFVTAISVAPQAEVLQYNLGALYFNMSRWSDAAKAFERSLALKPSGFAYSNLGTVRFFEGNYPEAARQFQRATDLQPANPVNWGNLGDALWQIPDQRGRAREAFEKARLLASEQLGLNPKNAPLRKSYALYLAKLGRYQEATGEITQALTQAPKDGNTRFYAARVYAVMGDSGRALSAIKECLALGYSPKEIEQEPDLAAVRKSPEYRQIEVERTKKQ